MFCLFDLPFASLLTLVHGFTRSALGCALVGFVATMVLDPIAARRGQAPLFFARLRPPQIVVASLAALLASVRLSGTA